VSLDQHSTQQTGGKFMQRTIFHLPGLAAVRDALERDFAEQVAAPVGMGLSQGDSGRSRTAPARPAMCGNVDLVVAR
jgi:formyltetrahydrofolate deformylase